MLKIECFLIVPSSRKIPAMRFIKHLTSWLILLTVITASGLVSAKVASGTQNLSGGLHQENIAANALMHQAKIDFNYDAVSGSPVDAKRLPDNAVVCRGGTCTADRFAKGSGVKVDSQGNLSGASVNSAPGKSVQELSQGIPNKQVGVTTVGDVRKAGGNVTPSRTTNNPNHCTLCGISPQKAEQLFTPTIRNPNL